MLTARPDSRSVGPDPTDPPVSWQRNSDSKLCHVCGEAFSLLRRRHHCRTCGKLVCDGCSTGKQYMVGSASFKRVCDACVEKQGSDEADRDAKTTAVSSKGVGHLSQLIKDAEAPSSGDARHLSRLSRLSQLPGVHQSLTLPGIHHNVSDLPGLHPHTTRGREQQEEEEAPDAEWTRRGAMVVLLRCVAETRFSVMFGLSFLQQLAAAAETQDRLVCTRAHSPCHVFDASAACEERAACLLRRASVRVLGLHPDEVLSYASAIGLLTSVHVAVVLVCVLSSSEHKRWRSSDVALCFKLNAYYVRHSWVRHAKRATIFIYLLATCAGLAIAMREAVVLDYASSQLVPMALGVVTLSHMHSPARGMERVAYSVYQARLEGLLFRWRDLGLSAPALLTAKLLEATLQDAEDASREKLEALGPAATSKPVHWENMLR